MPGTGNSSTTTVIRENIEKRKRKRNKRTRNVERFKNIEHIHVDVCAHTRIKIKLKIYFILLISKATMRMNVCIVVHHQLCNIVCGHRPPCVVLTVVLFKKYYCTR